MISERFYFTISNRVLEKTKEFLKISQLKQSEIVILWSGKIKDGMVRVQNAWLPLQYSDAGFYVIPGDELFKLNKSIYEAGERLVAQVHTHPTLAFHSDTDSEYSVTSMENGLSIVVPYFGAVSIESFSECAYFIYERGRWTKLSVLEIQRVMIFEG